MNSLSGVAQRSLPEFSAPPENPIELLRQWLVSALAAGVAEPQAMTLATARPDGAVSSRVVAVKRVDQWGLVFGTHTSSRKGHEVAANPYAAGTFYWRETIQQLNVAGRVDRLPDAVSDELFDDRPREARAVAAVSRQSEPLVDEAGFEGAVRELTRTGRPIPRPVTWHAYRLVPDRIEFWCGSPDRLHLRLEYEQAGGSWKARRLQP